MANTGPLDLDMYIRGVTNQAYQNWADQQQQMDWAKSQFAQNAGTAGTVTGRALDTSKAMSDAAMSDRALYEGTYVPAMQQQMDFARGYASPERIAAAQGAAGATSQISSQAAADAAKRTLGSYDIDPSAGRFAGLDAGLQAKAAADATAQETTAGRQTEQLGQQYLANAIATGAVLPGQVVNEAGAGMAAGNQAVNTGLATTASGAATMGTPMQWNQLGMSAYNQWPVAANMQTSAGLTANEQQIQREQLANQSSSGIGAAIGGIGGLLGGVGKLAGGVGGTGGWGSIFGAGTGGGSGGAGGGISNVSPGGYTTAQAMGPGMAGGAGIYGEEGGMVPAMAGGGFLGDILGTVGEVAGSFIPIPVVGPMIGKAAGNAIGDAVTGDSSQIGSDVASDMSFGLAARGGSIDKVSNSVPPSASPSRGAKVDDVHALLNEGEFVVPKDVASWYGEKYLQGLIEKAHREMAGPKAEPEQAPMPQAMAMSPPAFMSAGARGAA
jgi:hypothetical protein